MGRKEGKISFTITFRQIVIGAISLGAVLVCVGIGWALALSARPSLTAAKDRSVTSSTSKATTSTSIAPTTTTASQPPTTTRPVSRVIPPIVATTTTTPFASDAQAIKGLWRGYSDSQAEMGQAGAISAGIFADANNYPGNSAGSCEAWARTRSWLPVSYEEEFVVDSASIETDEGWIISPGAPLSGQKPMGRVYVMKVSRSFSDGTPTTLNEYHVTILDGKPRFFFTCPVV